MIHALAEILRESRRAVFFGGAGVSTESGIPDFRSAQGLYAARSRYGREPEELTSRSFFLEDPEAFYRYYRENLLHPQAKPGPAHMALAALESRGCLQAVVTQNIDGLHQQAGSRHVLELHGSVNRNYCVDCAQGYSLDYILVPRASRGSIPLCARCRGIVRPDVVLYDELLDDTLVAAATEAIARADTLLVGGTSLVVYPAAGLIRHYGGDRLVLINRTPTSYDRHADLVIRDSIGEVLSQAVDCLA